jgi:toxin FitB
VSIVVLDTDAASLLHRRRLEPHDAQHLIGATPAITFVTVGEFHKGMALRSWGERRRAELISWIARFLVVPYGEDVARRWGELAAAAQQRGRPRPVNDTWIAACCIADGVPLLTLNRKDFESFAAHDGLHLLGAN